MYKSSALVIIASSVRIVPHQLEVHCVYTIMPIVIVIIILLARVDYSHTTCTIHY